MALAHLQRFGNKKSLGVQVCKKRRGECSYQLGVTGDSAAFEQGGLNRDVFGGFGQAVFDGAHTGANF